MGTDGREAEAVGYPFAKDENQHGNGLAMPPRMESNGGRRGTIAGRSGLNGNSVAVRLGSITLLRIDVGQSIHGPRPRGNVCKGSSTLSVEPMSFSGSQERGAVKGAKGRGRGRAQ